MEPKSISGEEVAAIDAVFQQAPIGPPEEIAPIPAEIAIPNSGEIRIQSPADAPPVPLRDYLREIQQEYAAQQEEGKL